MKGKCIRTLELMAVGHKPVKRRTGNRFIISARLSRRHAALQRGHAAGATQGSRPIDAGATGPRSVPRRRAVRCIEQRPVSKERGLGVVARMAGAQPGAARWLSGGRATDGAERAGGDHYPLR